MKRTVWILPAVLMILTLSGASAMSPVIRIANQKITLIVDGMPLRTILKEFYRIGVQVKLDPDVNPYITADFKDRDIQDAFEEILKGYSHALIWKQNAQGIPELSEVAVFKPGKMNRALPLKSSENLKIEKNPETGAVYVKNKILIRFITGVPGSRIKDVLSKIDASINLIHKELGIYEITLPDSGEMEKALALFEKEKGVAAVEPDYAYSSPEPIRYDDGKKADTTVASSVDTQSSVPVAILDTGLMAQYLPPGLNQASLNAVSPDDAISDEQGHGTQMALIASGQVHPMGSDNSVFSNPVISIRAFDDNGYTSNAILIKSIDFAVKNNARVLSLSWGSETDSQFLESAMAYARAKGLVVVAAAGNSPTGKPIYPAAYESVISVSALAPDGKAWEKSNFGDFVDMAAPGFARLPVGYNGNPGTYAGTSISTAYVAGKIAAYLRDHPEADANISRLPE